MDLEQQRERQLHGISLADVMEKRRLDQALNAKEFAVLAGVSYSTARTWFRLSSFPVCGTGSRLYVFWSDFVLWRTKPERKHSLRPVEVSNSNVTPLLHGSTLPPRAARILCES